MAGKEPDVVAKMSELNSMSYARVLCLCALSIPVSAGLIFFNKVLMQPDMFPFAIPLATIQMFAFTVLSACLHAVAPSMYPGMEAAQVERWSLFRWFLPIGTLFAVMLYGSNEAYKYCSVGVLLFMKEAHVMVVFLISCAVGLQSMNRLRMLLIICVLLSATVSVTGDVRFQPAGIALQAASSLAECSRIVMSELVIKGRKLDPLTYTYFMAPPCLMVLLVANVWHWESQTVTALARCSHWVALNAMLAFFLNIVSVTVLKELSAMSFVFVGLIKNILIVMVSCAAFGEAITKTQCVAFAVTLSGVGIWSFMKVSPASVFVRAMERLLCMPQEREGETTALISGKV